MSQWLQTIDSYCEEETFLQHEIFEQGCYEPLRPIEVQEPLIIDVGANVGIFALWALQKWSKARLICLEPLPPVVKKLHENLSEAKIFSLKAFGAFEVQDRTMILPLAMGFVEETAEFFYFPDAPGESTRNVMEAAEQRDRLLRAAEEAKLPVHEAQRWSISYVTSLDGS